MPKPKNSNRTYETLNRPYGAFLERQGSGIITVGAGSENDAPFGSVAGSSSGSGSIGEPIQGNKDVRAISANNNESGKTDVPVKSEQAISDIWISNVIRSKNWKPKKSGFYMNGHSGYAEFSNVFISGGLLATTGSIGGWNISNNELYSGNIKIQSFGERILMGSATDPVTGVGVFLGKDGSDYEMRAGDPNNAYVHFDGKSLKANNLDLTTTVYAGEDLPAGRAVYVGAGSNQFVKIVSSDNSDIVVAVSYTNKAAQSFKTAQETWMIKDFTIYVEGVKAGYYGRVYAEIHTTSFSGPTIWSGYFEQPGSADYTGYVTYTCNASVEPNTTYYLVFYVVYTVADFNLRGSPVSSYPDGEAYESSGGWSTTGKDIYLVINEVYGSPNSALLATSVDGDAKMTSYLGITTTSANKGELVDVQIGGIYTGFSNILPGYSYYLTDSNWDSTNRGAVTLTPPTNKLLVGVGVAQHAVPTAYTFDTSESCYDGLWIAQSFKTISSMDLIDQVVLWLSQTEATYTIKLRIRSSLTGSDLYSTGDLSLGTYTNPTQLYIQNMGFTVTPNTTYYIVISITRNNNSSFPVIYGSSTSEYADGQAYVSTDSGATWNTPSNVADFNFTIMSQVGLRMIGNII